MAFLKVVIFTALLAASNAAPGYDSSSFSHYGPVTATVHAPSLGYSHPPVVTAHAPVEIENHAPANYEFKYSVKDGHTHDIKEQAEKRVGDKVEGYYSLVEPDGTTRTVHYTSDDHNGFNAVVSKSGHAVHPATPVHAAAVSPSYSHAAHPITYPAAPSYSHVAPAVSYSNTLGHGYTAGGLGHGPSLERGYESYY